MRVYRLSRKKYAHELSGIGAAMFGNRWNSKGTEIIYTAESRALAMAEVLVHLIKGKIPKDYMMLEIEIPETSKIKTLSIKKLHPEWNIFPHHHSTQQIGDQFVKDRKFLALKVPSAVVQGDYNILINPYHHDFEQVKVLKASEFLFDDRFF